MTGFIGLKRVIAEINFTCLQCSFITLAALSNVEPEDEMSSTNSTCLVLGGSFT